MSEVLPVVYLARHGETAWSLSGRHTGLTDLPLTERGEEHARLPGERLRGLALGRVLTSPRERAARTGELAGLGSAARVDHDLVERERPRRGDPVKAKRPRILVVDIGGTHVKLRATGQGAPRRFDSGPTLTPKAMIAAGAQGDVRIVDGAAAAGIVEVANEVGAELVVVGTHGRTGLAHVLLGSVAERVVRHAPCPVLVARLPQPAK